MPEEAISVTGNLKYDVQLAPDVAARARRLRERLSGHQPTWVAASTHDGEEAVALDAHVALLKQYPDALLLLAPRHPERAASVVRQCRSRGLNCRLLSAAASADASVLVVDELGLLVYCYAIADAAFVGGSLVDRGGHNPIEALLAGAPVISGPHTDNFAGVYRQLQAAGAAQSIDAATELSARLADWFSDVPARNRAISAGQRIVQENRGALGRVLALIDPVAG
jgi:3-deoxy-D-manno-octulosonic-acid transferase